MLIDWSISVGTIPTRPWDTANTSSGDLKEPAKEICISTTPLPAPGRIVCSLQHPDEAATMVGLDYADRET